MKETIVKITTNGIIGKIEVDGKELPSVKGYSIFHQAGQLPEITINLHASQIQIESTDPDYSLTREPIDTTSISDEWRRFN